jgi:alpha-acetolactate decarboxylase
MKVILSVLFLFGFIYADTFKSYGHFKNMIKSKNLEARVALEPLNLDTKGTYAVGAFADALGEITVVDGEFFMSYGKTGLDKVFKTIKKDESSMLLATMRPKKFYDGGVIEEEMIDLFFYDELEDRAKKTNIDMKKPFMFILEGEFSEVTWHIINGKNTAKPIPGKKFKMMKKLFSKHDKIKGKVIGFYHKGPQGIFTHPGENYHGHFISQEGSQAGHIDTFSVTKGMTLKLAQ